MKNRILLLIIVLLLLYLLFISSRNNLERQNVKQKDEKRAIFISYIELSEYLGNRSEQEGKKNIDNMIDNIKNFKFNLIILQVRSFSDSIYDSKYFPYSRYLSGNEGVSYSFDVLSYFIEKSHQNNIELHAWINPYRIRNTTNKEDIAKSNPAYSMFDSNDVNISDKGIYYNPASAKVQKLILDGVEELLINYDIDGIHYDDYFYPNLEIDHDNYLEYIRNNKNISIEDYHLLMVNNLVKATHDLTKKYKKKFGISPEGNIEANYSKNQADVYRWGESDIYVDYLMPQIYYGFLNEVAPFYDVLIRWEKLVKNSNVKIIPALAFYKIDQKDIYAKKGEYEWIENDDIIMRQVLLSRNINNYEGFAIFRYDSIFREENKTEVVNKEIKNLKTVID